MPAQSLLERANSLLADLAAERDQEIKRLERRIAEIRARANAEVEQARGEIRELRKLFPNQKPKSPPRAPKDTGNHSKVVSNVTLHAIALAILDNAGADPFTVLQMADWADVHDSTVRNALPTLVDEIEFIRLDRASGGRGQPALYKVLNADAINRLQSNPNGNGGNHGA